MSTYAPMSDLTEAMLKGIGKVSKWEIRNRYTRGKGDDETVYHVLTTDKGNMVVQSGASFAIYRIVEGKVKAKKACAVAGIVSPVTLAGILTAKNIPFVKSEKGGLESIESTDLWKLVLVLDDASGRKGRKAPNHIYVIRGFKKDFRLTDAQVQSIRAILVDNAKLSTWSEHTDYVLANRKARNSRKAK